MRYGPMTTVLCTGCGLLYRFPVASDVEMTRYYEEEYYEEYQKARSGRMEDLSRSIQKNRMRLEYLQSHIDFRGKRILDAGCGRALLLSQLAATGQAADLIGLEPSTRMVAWCQTRGYPFDVIQGTISNLAEIKSADKAFEPFDVVLLVGVLEHLPNPLRELTALRRVMAPDGMLYIYTHNEYPSVDWDPNERISLVHVLYLTEVTIRRLLAAVGFETVRLESHGTSMDTFARPGKMVPITPDLGQDQYYVLYDRYCHTMSRQALGVRRVRRELGSLVALPRRMAKWILRPWLPALRSYRRKRTW